MSVLRCPSCRRALTLPQRGVGQETVRCPVCHTTFTAPKEPPAASPVQVAPTGPARQSSAPAVPFDGPLRSPTTDPDFQVPAVASAVTWLRLTAISGVVASLGPCLLWGLEVPSSGRHGCVVEDDLALTFLLVPSSFVALAAHCLERRRYYGLVLVAAFLCSFLGVLAVGLTFALLWRCAAELQRSGAEMASAVVPLLVLGFTVVVNRTGIQVLFVLVDPTVRTSFQPRPITALDGEPREPDEED